MHGFINIKSIIVIFDKCFSRIFKFTKQMYHICNLKKIFLTLDKLPGKYQSTWDFYNALFLNLHPSHSLRIPMPTLFKTLLLQSTVDTLVKQVYHRKRGEGGRVLEHIHNLKGVN
jgi:hypothetical protein